jgi:hypothetical protein
MIDPFKTIYLFSFIALLGCGGSQQLLPLLQSSARSKAHLPENEILPIKTKTAPLGWNYEDTTILWGSHHLDSMVGIWEVKKECYQIGTDTSNHTIRLIYPYIFKYDGTYLTASFLMITRGWTAPNWMSKDGYYKMQTKWDVDTLKYLNPFQQWEIAGVFQSNVFINTSMYNDTVSPVIYRKIKPSEVHDYDKPILKYRKVFNYDRAW